jgi:hypothetical protein
MGRRSIAQQELRTAVVDLQSMRPEKIEKPVASGSRAVDRPKRADHIREA